MGLEQQMIQVLAEDGSYSLDKLPPEYHQYLAEVTPELLQNFYREMVLVRAFDREGMALQRQGHLALWVPVFGQEGCQVGAGFAIRDQDYVFPAYREHAIAKVRGVDLAQLMRLFKGVSHGAWDPKAHNFHIYTLVIGSQALHATGYAMGISYDGKTGNQNQADNEAVLAFFGDGATSQGDVSEAFVFAASYQAPVVFFVQNNNWAISVPVQVQSRTPLYKRAEGFGLPAVPLDGNDPIASYLVTRYWMDRARAGSGPAMIEAITYRMGPHTSTDDPTKYQDPELFEAWAVRDPIIRLEAYLRANGESEQFFAEVQEQAKQFVTYIRKETIEMQAGPISDVFRNVYSDQHPVMAEQENWLAAYEAAFQEEL